ncbi:MAG: YeeE/YedE family protein [Rubrivivax sp.]
MQDLDVSVLTTQVVWAAFAIALVFGAVAQRTHFCTMGAVADIVNIGDWGRMRMWMMAIGVAMLGFNAMVAMGWIEARHSIYAGARWIWASNLLGGVLFGVGMVFASGCGSKTLVRIGGGSLKAVVVFCVMGLAAYATMRGLLSVWRVATVDSIDWVLPAGQDLPSLLGHALGLPAPSLALGLGALLGVGLILLSLRSGDGRRGEILLAGLGIGGAVVGVWWVSGQVGYLAEHPVTLEEAFLATNSRKMESLTFVAPMAYVIDWLILYSDRTKMLTLAVVTPLGVVIGSAAVALWQRTFRWEGFAGTEDTALHLIGAVLMGVGGVTAMGCTIGQGVSGVSTLALGSFLAWAGIVLGAWGALRLQIWRLERAG